MASNSSKTAHVMNLLSKNRGASAPAGTPAETPAAAPAAKQPAAPAAAAAPAAPAAPATSAAPAAPAAPATSAAPAVPAAAAAPSAPAAAVAPVTPVTPIISSMIEDAAVSSQIKDALEAELAEETAATPPAEELLGVPVTEHTAQQTAEPASIAPSPAKEAAPAEKAAPVEEGAPAEKTVPAEKAAPAEEPSYPQWEPEAPKSEEPDEETGFTYINVMQTLVDEKADKYMKMFGICLCDRCKADVRAYTLNHLPPKYVLLGPREIVPRLTVYENKYSSDIVAQLINACKIVMNTPHHTR